MPELTPEDREQIQNQIEIYKQNQVAQARHISAPITPDGKDANKDLNKALEQGATPDKREAKQITKKIKGIWHNWRTVTLDAKSLEIEKIACQIQIERAQTKSALNQIKRNEQLANMRQWLSMHHGNLREIGCNAESKPSKFWYWLRRGLWHISKTTDNVPHVLKNLFWIGVVCLGLYILKRFNVI